jgi:hypothetical protein
MRAGLPELNEVGITWQIHTSFKHIVSHYAQKRRPLTLMLRFRGINPPPRTIRD